MYIRCIYIYILTSIYRLQKDNMASAVFQLCNKEHFH